jgi:hypothetical protein
MAGGLRFRPEATLFSTFATPQVAGTRVLVTAAQVIGIQRVGVYRMILVANAASTFAFQDTLGNPISATYSLTAAGSTVTLDTPINGDPWWQTGPNFATPNYPLGVGLQIVIGGTGPVAFDIWVAWGA